MTPVSRARLTPFFIAVALAGPLSSVAAEVCGARVSVRQIAMTPNEDGTRTVRYRASVETDDPACARVSFTIIRSYIRPDGTPFEDKIPVDVQVPGRTVDVEGDTVANTRRLIYWRAENISCQRCAKPDGSAAVPSSLSRAPASSPRAPDGDGGLIVPRVGTKTAVIGGAAAVIATGAVLTMGGGSSAADAPGTANATPTPGATATAAPTSAPTATPVPTPIVFPGAPPASPGSSENGEIALLSSDPPAGASINSQRTSIGVRLQVYIERVGTDMRIDLQMWSGGELCVRDTSAPLDLKARTPYVVQFPMATAKRCTAPFRTTLLRAYLNDRGVPKLVHDFPIGFDFVP